MTSMNGTIKRLVSDKGFGFILAGNGTEYLLPQFRLPANGVRRSPGRAVGHVRYGPGPKGRGARTFASLKP